MKRCDICLEETCGGKYNCNCSECKVRSECPRFLHATIRITNKCTQKCSHCCFESSPKSEIMMSIDKAKDISRFLKSNEVLSLNIMGGEFFCNPDWYEILNLFLENSVSIRLVSNGDWVNNEEVKNNLKNIVDNNRERIRIHISKDKWHNNINVDKAIEFLTSINANCRSTEPSEATDDSIVPIGRSEYSYTFFSSMGCYCKKPELKYSFLIDEEGLIYKCSLGVWDYASIYEYLDGGFSKRFKEFNKKFYGIFISNCRSCINSASYSDKGKSHCVKTD